MTFGLSVMFVWIFIIEYCLDTWCSKILSKRCVGTEFLLLIVDVRKNDLHRMWLGFDTPFESTSLYSLLEGVYMTMPDRCRMCSSTSCCVTWSPPLPVERPIHLSGEFIPTTRSYLPFWSYDHVTYWLRARARASERTRGNEP